MNHTPSSASAGGRARHHPPREEKIGVAKIRIRHSVTNATAMLGSFIAADKLLRSWAVGARHQLECAFDIEYLNGYRVSGMYPMWQKCTTRQSLGAYVRRMLQAAEGGARFCFGAAYFADSDNA